VIGGNSWRPGTPGHRFYEQVLSQAPATVGDAIAMAAALTEPFTAKQVQGHLRWIFTSAGGFLEVDGERFVSAPVAVAKPVKKPAEPVAKKVAKKSKQPKSAEAA